MVWGTHREAIGLDTLDEAVGHVLVHGLLWANSRGMLEVVAAAMCMGKTLSIHLQVEITRQAVCHVLVLGLLPPVGQGLRVWGLGFMVCGLWFIVYGLWFMVYGFWLRV